jgi:hypothetical protein
MEQAGLYSFTQPWKLYLLRAVRTNLSGGKTRSASTALYTCFVAPTTKAF